MTEETRGGDTPGEWKFAEAAQMNAEQIRAAFGLPPDPLVPEDDSE